MVEEAAVPMARSMFFEDFAVGQHFVSEPRSVTEQDLTTFTDVSGDRHRLHTDAAYAESAGFDQPILQGPFGIAAFFGAFHDLHLADDSVIALLDTNWRYLAPIHVGDSLRFEFTIVGCRRTSSGDRGVVNRHVVVINQQGDRVQEGTTAVLVRARDSGTDAPWHAFGTVPWGKAVAELLHADERFAKATADWDGAIGLRCGTSEVHLRIYRGAVIDVARRVPHGPDYTFDTDELTWTQLVTGPRNDFMRRAMSGQFSVHGSGYEYLRTARVLTFILDAARALSKESLS